MKNPRRKKGQDPKREERAEASFRDSDGVLHIRTQNLGDDEPDFFRRRKKGEDNTFFVFSPNEREKPKEQKPRHVLGKDSGRVSLVDHELIRQMEESQLQEQKKNRRWW